jgi:hypothetical protein
VDKGGVNHAIRQGCSTAQAFQIFQIASMNLGAAGGQGRSGRIGAGKPQHLMARLDELLNHRGTDKAGSTGYEHTHYDFSFTLMTNAAFCGPAIS